MRTGNKPFIRDGDFVKDTVNGRECVFTKVNYVRDNPEDLDGFYPIYHADVNDPLGDTPDLARELYQGFIEGRDCKGRQDAMPIDEGHKSIGFTGDQKELGYLVDLKLLEEQTDGVIVVRDNENNDRRYRRGIHYCCCLESGKTTRVGDADYRKDISGSV